MVICNHQDIGNGSNQMNVFTYTSGNIEAMETIGQVSTVSNVNAAFINDGTVTRASNLSFKRNTSSVIQTALWFPVAVLLTGPAVVLTLASVVLVATLNLRDRYSR